jgi:hypothetical protein
VAHSDLRLFAPAPNFRSRARGRASTGVLRPFALAGLVCSLVACESPEPTASTCTLAKGQVVARQEGLSFDGVKLLTLRGEMAAVWSAADGLWWRRLDPAGVPLAEARRLAEGCAGGMDATQADEQLWVACSRPARTAQEAGEVRVYRVAPDGGIGADIVVGQAGRDGRGVALSSDGPSVNVVFHEGAWGRHAVQRAVLEADGLVRRDVISDPARIAGDPASFVDGGHHYATWRESELSAEPEQHASVWIKLDDAPPHRVLDTKVVEASPSLSRDGSDLLLAFRDQRARDKRSELYVTRLNKTLGPQQAPLRLGRANGEGAPRLARCGSLHAAVLPREYGGEHYVAVHELDSQLSNRGGGHQYYANTREFVLASAACAGAAGEGALTLLIGERANPAKPGVELVTLRFSCP